MIKPDQLLKYPVRRIKAVDGMAVTAKVWDEAHEYHRQQQRYHALYGHGPGILAGLEVIASEPPDATVYVLPGVAVDPAGDLIVLHEPTAYHLGATAEGLLRLFLGYSESRPVSLDGGQDGDEPLYIRAEFSLEAAASQPGAPCLELARIRRTDRNAPLRNAADPDRPAPNEIDLRFRRQAVVAEHAPCCVGVAYLGEKDGFHARGLDHLTGWMRRTGMVRAWADADIGLIGELASYDLLYLVGRGPFQLNGSELNNLYSYLSNGGAVLMESCRHGVAPGNTPADASFLDLCSTLGIQLKPVEAGHPLLDTPNLFAAPPVGYETECPPEVLLGDGVIFSTADYGCLWGGERRSGTATREEIRTAHEWGANIMAYAGAHQNANKERNGSWN